VIEITFRPIDAWPDGWRDIDRPRVDSPFRTGYTQTISELRYELAAHDATHAHVQLALTSADLRQDGMLRARATVTHPGVILTVVSPHRTIVLGTDRFVSGWRLGEDWHYNLRACLLGLIDLRTMERYGLNGGDAQYAGFAALGAGGPQALGAGMTASEAWSVLVQAAGWADQGARSMTPNEIQAAYRDAARHLHPDISDGDAAQMAEVNRARDVLVAAAR
jgi:hypothetical protein